MTGSIHTPNLRPGEGSRTADFTASDWVRAIRHGVGPDGHSLLIMLVMAYLGKLPGRMKRLTWLLFGIYILQADVLIFMRVAAPALSALHPVLALADFALGLVLAREATAAVRAGEAPLSPQLRPHGSQGDQAEGAL